MTNCASIRDTLSAEQQAVFDTVQSGGGNDVLVIAGPGSGKTHTLISCLCGLVQAGTEGDKIVAITFTNNAAAEMQVRLVEAAKKLEIPALQRVQVSTFHSWVAQLAAADITQWTHPPVRIDTTGLAVALHLTNPDTKQHSFTKAEVNAADRHLEGSETFEAMEGRDFNKISEDSDNEQHFANLKSAVERLQPLLEGCQITTFGTLMASGVYLASKLSTQSIRWLFIDEAQDLNASQAAFVDAIQQRTCCRVFAIADDDQGIYKFRGASNQFLSDFGTKSSTVCLQLTENFRSTGQIVNFCRHWIQPNWSILGQSPKPLAAKRKDLFGREELSVVLLTASDAKERGAHARLILEAAKTKGLINTYGEVAALAYSTSEKSTPDDIKRSGIGHQVLANVRLPDEVFDQWITLCQDYEESEGWHYNLWRDFLEQCTENQQEKGEDIRGHPGLNSLYTAFETIRRIKPDLSPEAVAEIFLQINARRKNDFERFFFTGTRPQPDYSGDLMNFLSLHSCKGMEFPVVWLSGCGYAFSSKPHEIEEGQPNANPESGELAKIALIEALELRYCKNGSLTKIGAKKLAADLENRRLLYVGMSRATDLLLISAPGTGEHEDMFSLEIESNFPADSHVHISTREEAEAFAVSIRPNHRHPTWKAPTRHRVESFTSQTRQPLPSAIGDVEALRQREYPLPQSRKAMIGDQFHRIMHLLCLDQNLLQRCLAREISNADLIGYVSTGDPTAELEPLVKLLDNYFSDHVNKPWEWLANAQSEVPFTHVPTTKGGNGVATGETVLVKGFIDLVSFDENDKPNLIVDYKTGRPPKPGSEEEDHHRRQLHLYRDALAETYSVDRTNFLLVNYYPNSVDAKKILRSQMQSAN